MVQGNKSMKLIRDTWLIFVRRMQASFRKPVWIFMGLFQPLCFFVFFMPLLNVLVKNPLFGASSALDVFTPGLLIMMAMYSCAYVGFGLIDDIRSGVIERFQVTPINRAALLLGRVFRDIFVLCVQASFLLGLARIFGLSVSLGALLISFVLVVLVGFSLSCLSYGVAMILQDEDSLAPFLNFFLLPSQLLAGVMLPLSLAPLWLQRVAYLNPLFHAVAAARTVFVGGCFGFVVWRGLIVVALMAIISFMWVVRLFKRATL